MFKEDKNKQVKIYEVAEDFSILLIREDCGKMGYNWTMYYDEEVFTEEEKKYLKEYGEIAFAKKYHKCPICGNDDLATGDGCITDVTGCGWTKC